jgi:multidrug efflux pump subunit AcrB
MTLPHPFAPGSFLPIPRAIDVELILDRTTTIRSSLHEVESTLVIAVCLVVLVVFAFLRSLRAALIPTVAVPVSLIGTFGVMYLLGYSLDNLSLMALTISTGFVVDNAIVVLENVTRHIEGGMPRMRAALHATSGGRRPTAVPVERDGVSIQPQRFCPYAALDFTEREMPA